MSLFTLYADSDTNVLATLVKEAGGVVSAAANTVLLKANEKKYVEVKHNILLVKSLF